MKGTYNQIFRKCLLQTYQTSFTMYNFAVSMYGVTASFSTFDREFRRWREHNPTAFEYAYFKAEKGGKYKKFRKGKG